MTQICEDDWINKSLERRSVRDEVHSAFWKEVGALAECERSAVEAAPVSQRLPLVRLLQVTRDIVTDDAQKKFLAVIARAIKLNGLGRGFMGPVVENIDDLNNYHTKSLEHFFTVNYKFEGRREGEFMGG
ncbi:hypothetical protein [Allorhizobium terrae]|uniref:Uncharacterized protein n=1 Tax=Allorhizobium terrae TaxID=1848972 RepID=A0A4S3ZY03_9HYPH|nr:hypothetical protein [Allorhizobium terrae]THF50768.1 hypothetical protein E6C51_07890 [Allorhizobium terrae]